MNKQPYDETLCRVTADTLEGLALMLLVPEDEAPHLPTWGRRAAAVDFEGRFRGTLAAAVSDETAEQLAGNMLGLEDGLSPSPERQEDALKELANVICGNLLPAIAGTEPVFHIGAPRVLTEDELISPGQGLGMAGTARLFTETGAVDVVLFLEQSVLADSPA
jgi:CheY-specific phosphatase CheX